MTWWYFSKPKASRNISRARRETSTSNAIGDALEDQPAVFAAQNRFARPFRMRHEAEDVAHLVANTGNVVHRTVWILYIPEQDAVLAPQLLDDGCFSKITAFA